VVNPSSIELSANQISLLKLGLSFCPTNPQPHQQQTLAEFLRYDRKCRLNHLFNELEDNGTPTPNLQSPTLPPEHYAPCTSYMGTQNVAIMIDQECQDPMITKDMATQTNPPQVPPQLISQLNTINWT
jgi:hypothetical protein